MRRRQVRQTAAPRLRLVACRRLGLVGLALLLSLQGGCAHVTSLSDGELIERILPPLGIGSAPPAAPDSSSTYDLGKAPLLPTPRPDDVAAPETDVSFGICATKPITLDEAVTLAFQYQPRLRVLQERVEEARGRGLAAFAPFLPQVSFFNRGFVGQNPNGPRDGFALPLPEFSDAPGFQDYVSSELYMQWTLWDFGRTYGRFQQAELGIDIAALLAIRASQTVAYEVAAAYYRLLQAQASLRVARDTVRLAESVLDVTRKSLRAGLVTRDAVLRAEVQLAQDRRAVVTAERAQLVAVARLNQEIGLNVSAPTEVVDQTDEPPFDLSLAESLRRAVQDRRELQIAQRSVELAAEGERVAKAEFAPRIYFEGVAAGENGHKTLHGATETASINVSLNLFQGGRRLGDLRTANAALRAAAAQAQVVADTIAFEVNEAYRAIEAARRSIDLARPAVAQARENLRLVTRKYENGNATPTEIVDAETALTRAQQDLYTAQYEYLTALARMNYAVGSTPYLTPDGGK